MMEVIVRNAILIAGAVASSLFVNIAHAGGYAKGYGENPKAAVADAEAKAQEYVNQGKGTCVGPGADGKNDGIRNVKSIGDGWWEAEAHYSTTRGACKKKKSADEYLSDLGIKF